MKYGKGINNNLGDKISLKMLKIACYLLFVDWKDVELKWISSRSSRYCFKNKVCFHELSKYSTALQCHKLQLQLSFVSILT